MSKHDEKFSTWYAGTKAEWHAIPFEQREQIAFESTGCEVAEPTWRSPVD